VSLRIFLLGNSRYHQWYERTLSTGRRPTGHEHGPAISTDSGSGRRPPPRRRRPDRHRVITQPRTWDDLVPDDHLVRTIWTLVQRWDLTLFLQAIRARGRRPGRAATDPRLLLALCLYAATQGIGCGRKLDRLCTESDPYR